MRIALALLVALAACNRDHPRLAPDATEPTPDAMPDAATEVTLTSYVIDLITTQTSDTTLPRAYSEFSNLPDPDGAMNNTTAYQSLFP